MDIELGLCTLCMGQLLQPRIAVETFTCRLSPANGKLQTRTLVAMTLSKLLYSLWFSTFLY